MENNAACRFLHGSLYLGVPGRIPCPDTGKVGSSQHTHGCFQTFPDVAPWKMFFFILPNNSAKSFAILLSGNLFGLMPLIAVATNGYIQGGAYLFTSGRLDMCRRQGETSNPLPPPLPAYRRCVRGSTFRSAAPVGSLGNIDRRSGIWL